MNQFHDFIDFSNSIIENSPEELAKVLVKGNQYFGSSIPLPLTDMLHPIKQLITKLWPQAKIESNFYCNSVVLKIYITVEKNIRKKMKYIYLELKKYKFLSNSIDSISLDFTEIDDSICTIELINNRGLCTLEATYTEYIRIIDAGYKFFFDQLYTFFNNINLIIQFERCEFSICIEFEKESLESNLCSIPKLIEYLKTSNDFPRVRGHITFFVNEVKSRNSISSIDFDNTSTERIIDYDNNDYDYIDFSEYIWQQY